MERIEQSLGIGFAPELRAFYKRFEYLQIGAREIEWVRNIVPLTERLRTGRGDLPRE